jgi:hypothetical protein
MFSLSWRSVEDAVDSADKRGQGLVGEDDHNRRCRQIRVVVQRLQEQLFTVEYIHYPTLGEKR